MVYIRLEGALDRFREIRVYLRSGSQFMKFFIIFNHNLKDCPILCLKKWRALCAWCWVHAGQAAQSCRPDYRRARCDVSFRSWRHHVVKTSGQNIPSKSRIRTHPGKPQVEISSAKNPGGDFSKMIFVRLRPDMRPKKSTIERVCC